MTKIEIMRKARMDTANIRDGLNNTQQSSWINGLRAKGYDWCVESLHVFLSHEIVFQAYNHSGKKILKKGQVRDARLLHDIPKLVSGNIKDGSTHLCSLALVNSHGSVIIQSKDIVLSDSGFIYFQGGVSRAKERFNSILSLTFRDVNYEWK